MMLHYNNIGILKIVFAIFVIVTHSYALSTTPGADFLSQLTNGQIHCSYLGVDGFFIISGFLIFNSFKYRKNNLDYIWKRFIRIFPALFVALTLTVVMGFFVSKETFRNYFLLNRSVKTYILNNMSIYHLQYGIDGVFNDNPYQNAINGSLWTLAYEVSLYFFVMLSVFSVYINRNVGRIIAIFIALTCLYISENYQSEIITKNIFLGINAYYIMRFSSLFFFGTVLASIKFNEWRGLGWYCAISGGLIIFTIAIGKYHLFRGFLLPLFITSLGYVYIPKLSIMYQKIGDLSYGTYIYSFPVQQLLMYLYNIDAITLMIISLPISLACGYTSWVLIEKPCMIYRSVFSELKVHRIQEDI